MFSQKLKGQAGILKQQIQIGKTIFQKDALLSLTGNYDKIYDNGLKIIIVEVIVGSHTTYININIFKNAPALKRLIPKN